MKELGGEEECDVTYFPEPYVMLSISAPGKMQERCGEDGKFETRRSYFEMNFHFTQILFIYIKSTFCYSNLNLQTSLLILIYTTLI